MLVSVADRMEIVDRRTTADGFLATTGRISRTGNYTYLRSELGLDGDPNATVQIYRPEDAVFSDESMSSAAHRPLTLNHPPVFVDSKNWKKYSVGHAGGKVRRDGEFLDVDMLLMDSEAIAAVDGGAQISPGYVANIRMDAGVAPDGSHHDGVMEGPYKFNHIAILAGKTPNARGGFGCRLGDAWPVETKDSNRKKEVNVKTVMIDGLPIKTDDADAIEAGVNKLTAARDAATALATTAEKKLADAEAKAATDIAAKDAQIATMDAEIASLKKSVEDAKVTPEQMREMAKAHSALTDAATKMGFTVTDAMSDAEIKKGAVLKVLGDSYAEKTEAFFDAAFEIESGKLKATDNGTDPYRLAMGDRKVADFNVNDEVAAARKAREDYIKSLSNPASAEAK